MSTTSEEKPTGVPRGHTPRPWSARRGPAAVLALLGSAACGMLLYDQVAVYYGRPAAPWRTHTRDWLADTPGTSGWVIGAAAVLALLGLYLMFLALTPGGRRRLPMAPAGPSVRAVLDRAGAATLLRDAALHTPGVTAAQVRMRGRSRAVVWATLSYGDGRSVRAALHTALLEATDSLGLAHPPRLTLHITTPPQPRTPAPATAPTPTPTAAPATNTVVAETGTVASSTGGTGRGETGTGGSGTGGSAAATPDTAERRGNEPTTPTPDTGETPTTNPGPTTPNTPQPQHHPQTRPQTQPPTHPPTPGGEEPADG
ncbi:DUF6286 domain-containing protein [Streptomyces sp. 796.1]|uniref:DUF6286 domain-containing protein n=1 Tax=Streptomyces sp. 796.1 TaxID=3163029 RepID=UPI0039C9C0A0